MNRTGRILLSAACAVALLTGCTGSNDGDSNDAGDSGADADDGRGVTVATGPKGYGAIIRRTSDGVPHIYAQDLPVDSAGRGSPT